MRACIAPVILLASLASALPQQELCMDPSCTATVQPADKRDVDVPMPANPVADNYIAVIPTPPPNTIAPPSPRRQVTNNTAILSAIAGTYSLVNTSSTLNGVSVPDLPYGEAPVGLLIYTAAGFMSATITATEPEFRPNLTFPYRPNDTDADWAQVGRHSVGYAGPFRVNSELPATETEGQILHGPLTVANVPTWAGQELRRNYTVVEMQEEGELVKYLRIGSERGGGFRGVLWWKRVA